MFSLCIFVALCLCGDLATKAQRLKETQSLSYDSSE